MEAHFTGTIQSGHVYERDFSPDKNKAALSSDQTQEEWHTLADSVEAKREEEKEGEHEEAGYT
jgi:hypothetical protein